MNEFYVGQVQAFAFNFTPKGWLPCNGQLLPISTYSALFALLGTTYGGDGRVNFALPDLRGRASLHYGTAMGLSDYTIGERDGYEKVYLTTAEMPTHSHEAVFLTSSEFADSSTATNQTIGVSEIYALGTPERPLHTGTVKVGNSGNSQAHENRSPYIVLNYCIAVEGIFPSRT